MRVLFCIMAYPLGAFKLSCRSITFTKPSSLPVFNIMLPWEEDLDEGLKTFLLRQACGPPSILPNWQTRLCSVDGLCTTILKSENLPFLPHWEKGNFGDELVVFKVAPPEVSRERHVLHVVCCQAVSDRF